MALDHVVQVAQICTPLIATVALFVAFRTLGRNGRLAADAAKRKRSELTMEATAAWLDKIRPSNEALGHYLDEHGSSPTDNFATFVKDPEFRKLVRPILERIEYLALGVVLEVFDIDVVANLAQSAILYERDRFQPYIVAVRKGDRAQNREPQETAYEHLDKLCKLLDPEAPLRPTRGVLTDLNGRRKRLFTKRGATPQGGAPSSRT